MSNGPVAFSLEDLRRDIRYACLEGPGDPRAAEILDPYGFISQPAILRRLGIWIASLLHPDVNRLAAVGSSALGVALAGGLEINVPVVLVTDGRLLGEFSEGDRTAVVADITRTGETASACARTVETAGGENVQIFVIWDRSLGAVDVLRERELPLHVLMDEQSSTDSEVGI